MSAKFEVCSCGKHGRIFLEDGERSEEVCSKEHAFYIARKARITDEEVQKIMQEIKDSALVEEAEVADVQLVFKAEIFRDVYLRTALKEVWTPELTHTMLNLGPPLLLDEGALNFYKNFIKNVLRASKS